MNCNSCDLYNGKSTKPSEMIITYKTSPRVNTISNCKIDFSRKMLSISQKGKKVTIVFIDWHNVLPYEN